MLSVQIDQVETHALSTITLLLLVIQNKCDILKTISESVKGEPILPIQVAITWIYKTPTGLKWMVMLFVTEIGFMLNQELCTSIVLRRSPNAF